MDSYVYPNSQVGLDAPFYSRELDGATAQVDARRWTGRSPTSAVPFRLSDVDPAVSETCGYLPRHADGVTTVRERHPDGHRRAPSGGDEGSLIGVYSADGRERMIITAAMNGFQSHFLALSAGIIDWATRGVHLGAKRNHLSVHGRYVRRRHPLVGH
ncbi:MAG: hypothetical protein M9922_12160 [Microthrixaceae bacterium]|nr:hypothetical protein [Microthrixaceae bacterium]